MFRSTWITDICLLTLITALLFGTFLGSRNLSAPDELRYTEIPREMIIHHNYLIPTINNVKYFEKPPLFYWMQVASFKIFGLNDWSARLATALMGLLGVLATYVFARKTYNRKTAWFAALILSSMGLYFGMAHVITLDMTVSVFMTISLYFFYTAIKNKKLALMLCAFIATAGAMMTKGLIALIFPGLIIGIWLTLFQRWRDVKWLHIFIGFVVFILLVAPWHILVQLKAPEFLHFYFLDQQFLRYATKSAHRYHSPFFYIPVILFGTLPWLLFLPKSLAFLKKSLWKNRSSHEAEWFFFIWALCVLLFFSASNSKLIPYILPAWPPLAILIAHYLVTQKNYAIKPFVRIYLIASIIFVSLINFVDYFDNHTIKSLALSIKPHIQVQDEVVAYHNYYQDLPYYLERRITVDESFNELAFGAAHADTRAWMINETEFKQHWLSDKTLYVFMRKHKYEEFKSLYPNRPGTILNQDDNNIVIVNNPTEKPT